MVESARGSEVYVFDFDDTLVKTDCLVRITDRFGKVLVVSPREYATYVPKVGDIFDYSDFERVVNPRPIPGMIWKMREAIDRLGVKNVFVLTARGNPLPVKNYLESIGIFGVKVIAVGTSRATAKSDVIREVVRRSRLRRVVFYDDSMKYIAAVRELRKELPGVDIFAIRVK